jgi:hypothetical protein
MKKFINLELKAEQEVLIALLDKLKESETNKWSFEKKLTKDYATNISLPETCVACFKANSTKYFEATIWIVINDSELRVSNIVSRKVSYLGKDLYNIIVTDFFNHFVIKYLPEGCIVNLSSSEVSIEEIANTETAKKLIKWESLCNRSTGNTHPYDRERWFDFIITAVDTDSELSIGDLEQWLTEEKKWVVSEDDDLVEKLVIDFEYGVDLLKYYVGKS